MTDVWRFSGKKNSSKFTLIPTGSDSRYDFQAQNVNPCSQKPDFVKNLTFLPINHLKFNLIQVDSNSRGILQPFYFVARHRKPSKVKFQAFFSNNSKIDKIAEAWWLIELFGIFQRQLSRERGLLGKNEDHFVTELFSALSNGIGRFPEVPGGVFIF